MARKFIITEDRLIMGNVTFHIDLVPRSGTYNKPVLGGGLWEFNEENKTLFLWGASTDYGYANPEQIKRAISSPKTFISLSLQGFKVMHAEQCSTVIPPLETFYFLTIVPID